MMVQLMSNCWILASDVQLKKILFCVFNFSTESQIIILANLGINCSRPIKNKEGNYYSIENLSSGQHVVRLMNFLPGKAIFQVPPSARLFYQLGKFIAQLDESLKVQEQF